MKSKLLKIKALKNSIKIKNLKLRIIGYLILEIGLLVLFPQKIFAENLSVGIYPPILQIQTDPPASVKAGISIQNKSDQTITYNIYLIPFRSSVKNNGEPNFDKELLSEYKNFFDNIQVWDNDHSIKQVKLAPQEKKNLTLHLGIQKNEKPQDYYFSVVFITEPMDQTSKTSALGNQAGIGTNVLVSIGPKGPATGNISEFSAPGLATKGPVSFKLGLTNTGKSFFSAKGNVAIKNMFGQTIGQIDLVPSNVLANSTRFIASKESRNPEEPRVVWNEKFLLGFYTAEATAALSDEGPIVRKKIHFLAFPIELLLGILVALAIVIGIIRRVKAKEKEIS
ncbi:MAG: hypothetical protein AAB520_03020 [Patescibacteria group bacterium]